MSLSGQEILSLPRLDQLRHPGAQRQRHGDWVERLVSGRYSVTQIPSHSVTILMEAAAGIEPAHKGFVPRLPRANVEAAAGIEPAHKGFADPRLTTWLRRPEGASSLGIPSEVEVQTLALPLGYAAEGPERHRRHAQ